MNRINLKLAGLLVFCALFLGAGILVNAQTGGDDPHVGYCLTHPTALVCQPTPPPCNPLNETCPEDGGGSRTSSPDDDDPEMFWFVIWYNPYF